MARGGRHRVAGVTDPSLGAATTALVSRGAARCWSADPSSSASIDCPPDDSEPPYDPPPIPGMTGPSLLGVTPTTFEVPASGGLQVIGGGIDAGGGDGFFDSGSLLVSRSK